MLAVCGMLLTSSGWLVLGYYGGWVNVNAVSGRRRVSTMNESHIDTGGAGASRGDTKGKLLSLR